MHAIEGARKPVKRLRVARTAEVNVVRAARSAMNVGRSSPDHDGIDALTGQKLHCREGGAALFHPSVDQRLERHCSITCVSPAYDQPARSALPA